MYDTFRKSHTHTHTHISFVLLQYLEIREIFKGCVIRDAYQYFIRFPRKNIVAYKKRNEKNEGREESGKYTILCVKYIRNKRY